jgi:arylsulfate sulfotransferase
VKDNLFIIVPASVTFMVLLLFLSFGLDTPETVRVSSELPIIEVQALVEEDLQEQIEENDFSMEDPLLVLDPYGISPLSVLLYFETQDMEQFDVVVKGKEKNGDIHFISDLDDSHLLPIYGLYPNYTNTISIYAYEDGVRGDLLQNYTVRTGELPDTVVVPDVVETTYEYFGNDLMLLVPAMNSLPIGVDYAGDIRFYMTINMSFAPTILDNGHLLMGTDRLIVDPYYVTGLYEFDYMGKVYRDYKIPGGYHHDVFEMDSGNLLVLSNDFDGTVEDVVVEIDRNTGEIVKEIDIADYLNVLDGMSEMWTIMDWFHNNALWYDEASDQLLLSGRHQDIVISIDYSEERLNYVIGDPTNWSQDFVDEYFLMPIGQDFSWQYAQHSIMMLDNGDIFLFDNGNNRSKLVEDYIGPDDNYSRGVVYSVEMLTKTITQEYSFGQDLGSAFYSPYISNVDYYGEGHYLIHSGGHAETQDGVLNIPGPLYDGENEVSYKSMTYEVKDDTVMYYLETQDNIYRAKRISLYSDQTYYFFSHGLIMGNLKETQTVADEINIRFSFLDTVPAIYDLDMVYEGDRLKVSGAFDKEDTIYLKLVSEDQTLLYNLDASETSYTAMCTVTFKGDDSLVTFYVNETNVSGDFQVYLIINNREYNTYQHVVFK